ASPRSHTHKFAPTPTRDYYSLVGVFASTDYDEVPLVPPEVVEEAKRKLTDKEKKSKVAPKYPLVHALKDRPQPVTLRVHVRGSPAALGEEAPRRFLSILAGDNPPPFTRGSGRL